MLTESQLCMAVTADVRKTLESYGYPNKGVAYGSGDQFVVHVEVVVKPVDGLRDDKSTSFSQFICRKVCL